MLFVGRVILLLISAIGAFLLQFPSLSLLPPGARGFVLWGLILSFVGSIGSVVLSVYEMIVRRREVLREELRMVVRLLVGSDTSSSVRANIMTRRYFGLGPLRIAYWYGNYEKQERRLCWNRGQGAVGLAYEPRSLVRFDLSDHNDKTFEELAASANSYGMDREHWDLTRDIRCVVSVPIVRGDRMLGVLSVDDRSHADRSHLTQNPERTDDVLTGVAEKLASTYTWL